MSIELVIAKGLGATEPRIDPACGKGTCHRAYLPHAIMACSGNMP